MKTAKMVIESYKDPDGWMDMLTALGLVTTDGEGNETSTPAQRELVARHFDYHEYASFEIEVDEELNIVGGRFLPKDKA
ncbi:MAG TPA: hypothetical protein VFA98_11670 [Thermoanaerobaculia bacterium]|nr:hypothetical protein [Thermoanaerobaculia bacterium]